MKNTSLTQIPEYMDSRADEDFFEFRIVGAKGRVTQFQEAVIDEFGFKRYETIPLKEVGIRAKENRLKHQKEQP